MGARLSDEDWERVAAMPIDVLVDLASDLDILSPEEIDRRALLDQCVDQILVRARAEGLPLSAYDRDDLAELPPEHLAALGALLGVAPPVTVDAVVRAGERVWKSYQRQRPDSPVALCVPSLLRPLARGAWEDAHRRDVG